MINKKWYEFYHIQKIENINYYHFIELNEVELKESYTDNWLKKFFFYEKLNIDKSKYHDIIQIYDILDLLKSKDEIKLNEEKLNI